MQTGGGFGGRCGRHPKVLRLSLHAWPLQAGLREHAGRRGSSGGPQASLPGGAHQRSHRLVVRGERGGLAGHVLLAARHRHQAAPLHRVAQLAHQGDVLVGHALRGRRPVVGDGRVGGGGALKSPANLLCPALTPALPSACRPIARLTDSQQLRTAAPAGGCTRAAPPLPAQPPRRAAQQAPTHLLVAVLGQVLDEAGHLLDGLELASQVALAAGTTTAGAAGTVRNKGTWRSLRWRQAQLGQGEAPIGTRRGWLQGPPTTSRRACPLHRAAASQPAAQRAAARSVQPRARERTWRPHPPGPSLPCPGRQS